jgi:tetratricopeptide (TPR) repeat protein
MTTRVSALLAAAQAVGRNNPARTTFLKQAEAVARQLARFPDVPTAIRGRCLYSYVTGDDDTLLELVRQGKQRVENAGAFEEYEWEVLYRRKQFDEALAALRASRSVDRRQHVLQAIVLATLGRTSEAERLLLEVFDLNQTDVIAGLLPPCVYLLGPDARTDPRELARRILLQLPSQIAGFRDGWYGELLKFNAGQMGEAELVRKAGGSRYNQCEAYFSMGLHKLADRKRAEAKECFTKSVESGVFSYDEYRFSRAFLACIDDPNWLPWLERK